MRIQSGEWGRIPGESTEHCWINWHSPILAPGGKLFVCGSELERVYVVRTACFGHSAEETAPIANSGGRRCPRCQEIVRKAHDGLSAPETPPVYPEKEATPDA